MIKVENGMLVLDSTFTKDDVKAINDFVEIAKEQERESILKVLEDERKSTMNLLNFSADNSRTEGFVYGLDVSIGLVKGEK